MAAIAAMEWAISREGKNAYTQTSKRYEAGSGWSDCSSLMWWAYKQAYGIDIGEWTGAQVLKGDRVALYGGKRALTHEDCENLQIGDLVFFGEGDAKHVEMYVGNDTLFGHGSGTPSYKNALTYYHSAGVYQARRYYVEERAKKDDHSGIWSGGIVPLTDIRLPEVKRGCSGNFVAFLQAFLNLFGYGLTIDGDFGILTEAALMTFQEVHGLTTNGIAGADTWRELLRVVSVENGK